MMTGFGGIDHDVHSQQIPTTLKLKYETPKGGKRIKAVCFHPKMSWVIVALHSGYVQIWDYEYAVMYQEYYAHAGPCRSVDFHLVQPLFATGGDDHMVKVFDYKKNSCEFTLQPHLDYVRSVQFHEDLPWIVSASDDHTISIINWQNRTILATLTGHSHYVMSAKFHPTEDLIVSASLDLTVRMWDISNLRERSRTNQGGRGRSQYALPDDYKVKFVFTGHQKGVNWADFHPTMPYVVSGGDDRQICVFQYGATDWNLKSSYKSHYGNVGMVTFHPKTGYILSASEDSTVRVFPGVDADGHSIDALSKHTKDSNRFWAVTCHPTKNLIAVGHDSGTQVLKLNRERVPAMASPNDSRVFTLRNHWITVQDFETVNLQQSLIKIPAALELTGNPSRGFKAEYGAARALRTNPLNHNGFNFIVNYTGDHDTNANPMVVVAMQMGTATPQGNYQVFHGHGAAFIARNRLAILEAPDKLKVIDSNTFAISKTIELTKQYSRLFFAGSNRVFLRQDYDLHLYDITTRSIVGSVSLPCCDLIDIILDASHTTFAAVSYNKGREGISRPHITICQISDQPKDAINKVATHLEGMRIKSGVFNENKAFIYSTCKHTKYLLPWGDSGVVQSQTDVIYLHKVVKNSMYYIDRAMGMIQKGPIDTTEINFKTALYFGKLDKVAFYVKNAKLCGSAILGHLKQVGYPEVALSFIEDPLMRFNLALSYGNIKEAKACATVLDRPQLWSKLADAALMFGKYAEAEAAYQRQRDMGRLIHLYMITGNTASMKKMAKALKKTGDSSNLFFHGLISGGAEDRKNVLEKAGHQALADQIKEVRTLFSTVAVPQFEGWDIKFVPDIKDANHKLNLSAQPPAMDFEVALQQTVEVVEPQGGAAGALVTASDSFGDLGDDFDDVLDDLELDEDDLKVTGAPAAGLPVNTDQLFEAPSKEQQWAASRPMNSFVQAAAGEFGESLQVLRKTCGIKDVSLFSPLFESILLSGSAYFRIPGKDVDLRYMSDEPPAPPACLTTDAVELLERTIQEKAQEDAPWSNASLMDDVTAAMALASMLYSSDCTSMDRECLKETVEKILESIKAVLMMKAIAETSDTAEQVRLTLLMALCTNPVKSLRTKNLKAAIGTCFKAKCYQSTAEICRLIIHQAVEEGKEAPAKIKSILAKSEQHATEAFEQAINTNDPYLTLCTKSLEHIPGGLNPSATVEQIIECPLCHAKAKPMYKGDLCAVCGVSELGFRVI